MRLPGRLEYPEALELRRGGACGLRRKRPDGYELGIGSGDRVYAAGHPGNGAPGQCGLELEVRDACGSEVFGAGDAVVIRKYFRDVDHADIVAPKPPAGTGPGPAMCKRACPADRAGCGHLPRPGWCTSAAGNGHVRWQRAEAWTCPRMRAERRRGMSRVRRSGWTCCHYVHPWPRRLGMSHGMGGWGWRAWGGGGEGGGAPKPWPAGSAGTRPACQW